jgi:hypothetical protein
MAKREKIYFVLVVFVVIGFFAYTSNTDTKDYTIYNRPPSIDRLEITPELKRVGEEIQFAIAATNHTHREIYDNCGADLHETKSIDALATSILIAKGNMEIISAKLIHQRSSGNTGVFHYAWTPREPGKYRVTIRLSSQDPWVHYDTFHGQEKESVSQEKTFSVMGD